MKRIDFAGHEILVDEDATRVYREMDNNPCNCAYCRNFRQAFREYAPETVRFLEQFGIDTDHPLEISEYGRDDVKECSLYSVYYAVKGELPDENLQCSEGDVTVALHRQEKGSLHNMTKMTRPCFVLEAMFIQLPWVLEESYE